MRERSTLMSDKRRLGSILLVCVLVATSIFVAFPLTVPKVKAQTVQHLNSTFAEDGVSPYDVDGVRDGVVHWDVNMDHWIMDNYTVNIGDTLDIPALYFMGNPLTGHEITFKEDNIMIHVYGTLITHTDDDPFTRTLFYGEGVVNWKGIYFYPNSEGCIIDCTFMGASHGVLFSSDNTGSSKILAPGINMSTFMDMGKYGLRVRGATGYLNMESCSFIDTYNSAVGCEISGTDLNVKGCTFSSHGNNTPSLFIRYCKPYVQQCAFVGNNRPGSAVLIGKEANGTILDNCDFEQGAAGDYFVSVEGSIPLLVNCTFDTSKGELSVLANESYDNLTAHPAIRNPTAKGNPSFWDDSFDNSTMNAIGNSSVTLQWYMNVYVDDPDGNLIENAPVWVEDRNGDGAQPPSKQTASSPPHSPGEEGWAKWFVCTELIQYNTSVTYYSPFKVSAENNSMKGYAFPEVTMNMSKEIVVTVPFNPTPNVPPIVSSLPTPFGVQTGYITIDFMLEDPNPGDDGNLSVLVEFSTDGSFWRPATAAPGSDLDFLSNNTLYHFIWDSANLRDLENTYSATVFIRITPYDRAGAGTPRQTGTFTVDNEPPILVSGPTVEVTNTTAIINWTVHENADAVVWYGLYPDLVDEASNSSGTTLQSVKLTNLQPGRNYTYVINSTDAVGNKFSSYLSMEFYFETEVHIVLYQGWNMISIPPSPPNPLIEAVLAPIAGQYEAVQWYDPTDPDDPWKHYKPGKPDGNDLNFILPTMGFWIYMKNDAVFIPDQEVPPSDSSLFIPLVKDWNFVGYPSVTTRDVDTALGGVPYDMVQTYDAATGQWLSYDPNTGSGDLTEMELSRGYWIHATADHNWEVYYV